MQCKEPLTLHNLKAIRNLKGVGNKIQAEIEQILVNTLQLVGSFYGRSIRTMIQERAETNVLFTINLHVFQKQRQHEDAESSGFSMHLIMPGCMT